MRVVRAVVHGLGQLMHAGAGAARGRLLPGIAPAQLAPDEPVRCATAAPSYRFLRHAEALGASGDPRLALGGDARLVLINARRLGELAVAKLMN
jgi:hypothetical protein